MIKQKPNAYIATKPTIFKWVKNYWKEGRVILIGNGVNIHKFTPTSKPVNLPLEKPIYLCVGAFSPEKSIELAIKAVSRLKRGSLLVIGSDGPLKEKLSRLGQDILGSKRFLIIKNIPYDKMPNFYTLADVFTLPSAEETFGNVYIEAMASGLPVVAPDDEDKRFIIGAAGILCNVNNIKTFAHALEKASTFNFGTRPIEQAKKFRWEKIYKQYKNLIVEILR